MRSLDSPITLVDERENVVLIFCLEARKCRVIGIFRSCCLEFCLQAVCVSFGARSEIHFLIYTIARQQT